MFQAKRKRALSMRIPLNQHPRESNQLQRKFEKIFFQSNIQQDQKILQSPLAGLLIVALFESLNPRPKVLISQGSA